MRIVAAALLLSAMTGRADLPCEVVLLSGQHVPGLGLNENFLLFTYANGNAAGQLSLGALASGVAITFANDGVLLAGGRDALELIAREGDPAPTSGGELYQFFAAPSLTPTGTAIFRSTLNPSGFGFFRHPAGGPTVLLVRDGGSVDNTSTVLLGTTTYGNRYAVDDAGNAYFIADLTGSSVTAGNNRAVLRAGLGGATTIARSGITIPAGVPEQMPAIRFDIFNFVNANASGQVAFGAMLFNATSASDLGFWLWSSGSLSLVARESGAAPGLSGATFAQMGSGIGIGDGGTVAFCAVLAGTGVTADNESSVWAGKPGALKLIAREGDAAPGLDPGVVFDDFVLGSMGDITPSVNANGRIAFLSRVRGPGITDSNNDCLWVQDGDGVIRLVLREGTLIPNGSGMNAGIGTSTPLASPFTLDPMASFKNPLKLIFSADTSGGSFDGIYEASVPPTSPDTMAPTIRLNGPAKRPTRKKLIRINGTSADNIAVARVEYRQGNGGYRAATGTSPWRISARLKIGANKLFIRSVDSSGNRSAIVRVLIRRTSL
jgi:hypothetical protein